MLTQASMCYQMSSHQITFLVFSFWIFRIADENSESVSVSSATEDVSLSSFLTEVFQGTEVAHWGGQREDVQYDEELDVNLG